MRLDQRNSFACRLSAIAILLGFVNGCNYQNTREQFPRRYGPPHQRLDWKADDFFTDANVLSLCKAIEAKDLNEIDRLVNSGVDVNAKGRANMTPLVWAFPMGEEVFKKMLELRANPNVQLTERVMLAGFDKGKSVMSASIELADGIVHNEFFHDVCMDNYLSLVLSHGGNPNLEDENGDNVFVYSMGNRYSRDKVRPLVAAGGDVNHRNHRGQTPVMLALPSYDYMLGLLEAGADYRISDNLGWDLILLLENSRTPERHLIPSWAATVAQEVFDWLTNEGVNWEAARAALNDKDLMKRLDTLPADYKHRRWLPQRPTLKKTDAKAEKPGGQKSLGG